MSTAAITIYGAGGHARVVAALAGLKGCEVRCFFDENVKTATVDGIPVMAYDLALFGDTPLIIAIGNNAARERLAGLAGHNFGTLTHPGAIVASSATIGEGTVILAGALVQAAASIGRHAIINAGACIDHDAVIEDFVSIYPQAYIGGGAVIKKGAVIGPGAVIMRRAVVEAGQEVPPLTCVK
jgi:acetyltransferase EpsM